MTQLSSGRYDAIVIGGGVNGLTCAAHLAKNGVRTLLVEQRAELGGCAAAGEIAPGFRVPTLAHATGPIRRDVVEELQLYLPRPRVHRRRRSTSRALAPDGRPLVLWDDARRTADGLARRGRRKTRRHGRRFSNRWQRLGALIGRLFIDTPPSLDAPTARDVFGLMQTLGAFRVAADGRSVAAAPVGPDGGGGPRQRSDRNRAAARDGGGRRRVRRDARPVVGGQRPATAAVGREPFAGVAGRPRRARAGRSRWRARCERAATRYGVEIRTGAAVARIEVKDDRAVGVTLAGGQHLESRAVVSAVDPKRTFLSLCDAEHLPPEFLWRIKHYRIARHAGEGQRRALLAALV